MSQNLISSSLPPESKEAILTSLQELKSRLDFLLAIQVDDVKGLFKAGNGYYPFIERAYNVLKDHPEIMSGAFNIEEFFKDYMLAKDLTQISNQISQLAHSLDRTMTAVLSDALAGSLEVYSAVKINKDRIPGLELEAQEMAVFFQKTNRKTATSPKPAQ